MPPQASIGIEPADPIRLLIQGHKKKLLLVIEFTPEFVSGPIDDGTIVFLIDRLDCLSRGIIIDHNCIADAAHRPKASAEIAAADLIVVLEETDNLHLHLEYPGEAQMPDNNKVANQVFQV